VINIDTDRRTVTAKFVLYITVCLKVSDSDLKKFLSEHLILEFAYTQGIFIPEDITRENSPYLITKMTGNADDSYVTYRIKGPI
jgi:hypothetical protein